MGRSFQPWVYDHELKAKFFPRHQWHGLNTSVFLRQPRGKESLVELITMHLWGARIDFIVTILFKVKHKNFLWLNYLYTYRKKTS